MSGDYATLASLFEKVVPSPVSLTKNKIDDRFFWNKILTQTNTGKWASKGWLLPLIRGYILLDYYY